jgi:hypothetical protein
MSDEATEVLLQEIDTALSEMNVATATHIGCERHNAVQTGLTVLLRCERARLQAQARVVSAASIGGGIGGILAGAASYFVAKYFSP